MTYLLCFTGERKLLRGACVLASLLRFSWRSLRALVVSFNLSTNNWNKSDFSFREGDSLTVLKHCLSKFTLF